MRQDNTGRWEAVYGAGEHPPHPYGDATTYVVAEQWLAGLDVEDWGCGFGWFKTIHQGGYLGVDGTAGYADEVADLVHYRSSTPGLLLRHVLEHNQDWRTILDNAAASCTGVLVVVTFVPTHDGSRARRVGFNDLLGVPDLSLPHRALAAVCPEWTDHSTGTQYGAERVYVRESRC